LVERHLQFDPTAEAAPGLRDADDVFLRDVGRDDVSSATGSETRPSRSSRRATATPSSSAVFSVGSEPP
jgi:hypothetical protein